MPSISAESENTLNELPLHRVRVLEISTGKVDMCGRILADLGADVVLVEPESGSPGRSRPPFHLNESLYFASHSANKRSVCLDLTDSGGQSQFLQLIQEADILIESTPPGTMAGWSLGSDVLHNRNPQLVILSISDFGQTGPYRDFSASNSVQLAMAGMLCRSGLPGREPLLPPGDLAWECSAVQAAWVVLVSYWQSQHIGVGDHVDFSLFEATAQILDPIMGVTGSADAARTCCIASHCVASIGCSMNSTFSSFNWWELSIVSSADQAQFASTRKVACVCWRRVRTISQSSAVPSLIL